MDSAYGYWILSLFARMGTNEIASLQALPAPWSAVDWRRRCLKIPATRTGVPARAIPSTPALNGWLAWLRETRRPFMPRNFINKTRATRAALIERRFRSWRGPAHNDPELRGYPPSYSFARRAYMANLIALGNLTWPELTEATGQCEETLLEYYRGRVGRRAAQTYFGLTPAAV